MDMTRRGFGITLCGAPFSLMMGAEEAARMPWNAPATVARVYLAGTPQWPMPTLDIAAEVKEIEAGLADVQRKHTANVKFVGGEIIRKNDEVAPWIARMGDIDAVLIIPLTQPTPGLQVLVDALKVPALFFSRPYASHSWSAIATMQKAGKKIDVLAASSYGNLDPYMQAFRTVRHLRKSKILVGVANPKIRSAVADAYHAFYGTTFQYVGGPELKAAFDGASVAEAKKESDAFVKAALRVVEPSPKEIQDGLRFYLGLKNMLRTEQANALTIDCFGSLRTNTLPAYPCIAWSKFNDAGMYGVCEADLQSTMTQLLVTSFAKVPGFVSDPVFDVSRNEVIHAHCVSATRMKGAGAPASPYIVRNHLETNEGAVLQVLMPAGETITVARFLKPTEMLVSTAEVIGPGDDHRGCRSQIRTRVANPEKWLRNYTGGLHRVIFYGDHVRSIEMMGRLMGFSVTREV
jgi:L-fucose isomerase-like protein